MVSSSTEDADDNAHDHEAPSGLLDRIMQPRVLIAWILVLLVSAYLLIPIARQPWELDARSPVVESIDGECGPPTGAIFTIKVEGRRYRCGGSDHKCPEGGPVAVAYDPADPSRCRVAANVDRISDYESLILSQGCGVALFMIAALFYRRSEALRRADRLDGATTRQRRRARLRIISAVILIASMAAPIVGVVLLLLGTQSSSTATAAPSPVPAPATAQSSTAKRDELPRRRDDAYTGSADGSPELAVTIGSRVPPRHHSLPQRQHRRALRGEQPCPVSPAGAPLARLAQLAVGVDDEHLRGEWIAGVEHGHHEGLAPPGELDRRRHAAR